MKVTVYDNKSEVEAAAACQAAEGIKTAILSKGCANVILAADTSQLDMINVLACVPEIDWSCVTVFGLSEFMGVDVTHPASFRRHLTERFVERVGNLKGTYFIKGDSEDPEAECRRMSDLISKNPADVACVGIGENGHLAFNTPPADFTTDTPYVVVQLNQECREKQLGENSFSDMESVPLQAISMSLKQIMKSRKIIAAVPEKRKAQAVRNTLKENISPEFPASILRSHPDCHLFVDKPATALM
ncbi:MAG: 6-phosphogluconolactonase [Kiritimatiellia bacterium]